MAIATLYHKNRFFISVKWTFFISVSIRQSVEAASFMIHVTGKFTFVSFQISNIPFKFLCCDTRVLCFSIEETVRCFVYIDFARTTLGSRDIIRTTLYSDMIQSSLSYLTLRSRDMFCRPGKSA